MDYWEKRQEEMYKAGEMQVNQYFTRLEKAFNQAKRELQKTIEAFYFRYAKENGLSYAEAQKRLNAAELGDLQDYIGLVMQNIGKYNQTVNNLSVKARVTRYQALEAQIDAILRQLYAVDYEAMAEQTMQEVYEESYYQTWYNIDQYQGFHSEFAQMEPRAIQTLLEYPFNGAAFSSRLWKQKDHLQTQLMEAVTTMMIQGKHPKMLAADFAKKMNSKKFAAYRLLHTESSFLMSEATHAGYKEDGVKKYQILATLDSKTCGMCGDLDRKVYEVGKEVVGVNMPPFHPLCRCTDTPYYDDTDRTDMTRAARDPETGKSYKVPADMTYNEWKKEYLGVESDSVWSTAKRKAKGALLNAKVVSFDELPRDISETFRDGLKAADSQVTKLLEAEIGETDFYLTESRKSEYIKGINAVGISKNADPSTLAHELFHKIDTHYGVTGGSTLIGAFEDDFKKIDNIVSALSDQFPDAFELSYEGHKRLKEPYRGVSDIISALTNGEINFGYGHSKKYWSRNDQIRMQEIWAQCGRIYFSNDPKVVDMAETLFPSGTSRVKLRIRRLVKNVERQTNKRAK